MDLQEAYVERRQAELDALDAEIKTFEFKVENVRPDEQLRFYDDLQSLRVQYAKTREKLGELRESSGQKWNQLKENLETAWTELQNGMQRALNDLK